MWKKNVNNDMVIDNIIKKKKFRILYNELYTR